MIWNVVVYYQRIVSINHSWTSRVIRFQQTTTCTHRMSLLITYGYQFCSLSLKLNYEIDLNESGGKKILNILPTIIICIPPRHLLHLFIYVYTYNRKTLLSGQGFVFLSLSLSPEFIKPILFKGISHKIRSVFITLMFCMSRFVP